MNYGATTAHQMPLNNNSLMDTLKSNMMTMFMINNMNGNSKNPKNDAFSMIYMMIVTQFIDLKNVPFVMNFFMKKYNDKLDTIKHELSNTTKDITDNKVKKKTASITVTVNVNNPENITGHALLDYITNNKNTTHVSYIRENFILNQKDVINIDEEIFARMTESTSDNMLNQPSTTSSNSRTNDNSNGGIVQIIEVYSFTKTTDQLRSYLDKIKQNYTINVKNKLGNKRYFFNMFPMNVQIDMDNRKDLSRLPPQFSFIMKHFQTNRKFSNLFGEDIDIIRNRVNFFCKNKKWYDEKGIPYTLGLLLSGNPGTGKTSTIKCLANETNRHICNINLNNDMTKTQLENLFFNENINVINPSNGHMETYCIPLDQRIYVLEDVDCQSDVVKDRNLQKQEALKSNMQSSNKYKTEKEIQMDLEYQKQHDNKHKVDLSFLLNLLDGVLENPGRIIIMTSNHPDVLDSAFIRPGRVDVIAKFRNCTNKTVIQMIEFFYDMKLSEDEKGIINGLKEEMVTPAEMSKIMFENFSDYKNVIDFLENLNDAKEVEDFCSNVDILHKTYGCESVAKLDIQNEKKESEEVSVLIGDLNVIEVIQTENNNTKNLVEINQDIHKQEDNVPESQEKIQEKEIDILDFIEMKKMANNKEFDKILKILKKYNEELANVYVSILPHNIISMTNDILNFNINRLQSCKSIINYLTNNYAKDLKNNEELIKICNTKRIDMNIELINKELVDREHKKSNIIPEKYKSVDSFTTIISNTKNNNNKPLFISNIKPVDNMNLNSLSYSAY